MQQPSSVSVLDATANEVLVIPVLTQPQTRRELYKSGTPGSSDVAPSRGQAASVPLERVGTEWNAAITEGSTAGSAVLARRRPRAERGGDSQ